MNDAERIRMASANDVAALLGGGLQGELVEMLAASPRFAPRLHAAAERRLGELRAPKPAVAALALTPAGLSDIVRRAGAVWHAAAIARVIDTSARRHLMASLGPDVYAIALEGRGLAPPAEAVVPPDRDDWAAAATTAFSVDIGTLREPISTENAVDSKVDACHRRTGFHFAGTCFSDGACCWSAWRTLQPPAVASRLALLGCNVLPARIHQAFGPAIVDWLLDRP
jgi:hypothetical protein